MSTISVIVPVYNTEKYLHRCVDSILAQTFADFELILVDDGSPDNSGAICDEYAEMDSRVHVFHQENQGQAAARNHALDWMFVNSDSQFISFIDSDDWVHPKFLELLLEGIRRYNVNICQCNYVSVDSDVEFEEVSDSYLFVSPKEQFCSYYCSYICMNLFRREVWREHRFPEGQIYEDLAIWYKLLFAQDKIVVVNTGLYYYYQNPGSTMRQDWHPGMLARMDAWDAQIDFFNKRGDKELVENAVKRYCHIAYGEYHEIEQSSRLTKEEKKENQAILARKIRKLMLNNHREVKNDPYYLWLRSVAFPKYDWCFWFVRSIPDRLKRLFKRK